MSASTRWRAACLLVAMACPGQDVLAQAPAAAHPGAQQVQTLREIALFPHSDAFPAEAKVQRLSGEVMIRAEILATGKWVDAQVETSSGSAVLDDVALTVVAGLASKPRDADALSVPVRVPIGFSLDSMQTLPAKTCEEFNHDFAQYRTLKPNATADDMRVFDLVSGIWVATKGTMALDTVKRLPSAPAKVASTCAKRPRAKFMDTFMEAMR